MKLTAILTPSTRRIYPNAPLPGKGLRTIEAALNERFSFQAGLRSDEATWVRATLDGPEGWSLRVRRVGLVPLAHHNTPVLQDPLDNDGIGQIPGFVPDPLFDEDKMLLPQEESNAFWFSIVPAPGAKAGRYGLTVTIQPLDGEGNPAAKATVRKVAVVLRDVVIPERHDFSVTHWLYSDTIIDWYKTDLFDKRYWDLLPAYFRDIAEHGQDTIFIPIFTPPLDGVKRPSQLLRVTKKGKDQYAFDWRDVRRYVRLAKESGFKHFEWSHLFTQWGAQYAIRIYEGQGAGEKLLWPAETDGTDPVYRAFLAQFLPAFKRFLVKEGILEASYFHISDEPHGAQIVSYRAKRELIRELAPWIKCMDALSDIEFAREEGLVDMPIPGLRVALNFHKEGITSWCYYCSGPRDKNLQHLMDTPLAKIAMHGFVFYRWPYKGFLHWGLNYWCVSQKRDLVDPFVTSDAERWPFWGYGDPFYIYPGEKGPIDSVRWEIFGESMQDYALLQMLDIDREGKMLAPIESFKEFPKDADWRLKAKKALYKMAEAARKAPGKTAKKG